MNKRIFKIPGQNILLGKNEVHIWNFDLDAFNIKDHIFKELLSEEELVRASRFHFEHDQRRFISSRGLLRILTGIYTRKSPNKIHFNLNNFGKPSLSSAINSTDLHFNLSHSKNFMSVGFVQNALIGVDVELMKPMKNHLEIANRYFSHSEISLLSSFPPGKITEGFYSCWTAKEAVIKLFGEGLAFPLNAFDAVVRELSIGENFKYEIIIGKKDQTVFVELFRFQEDLFGACALDKNNLEIIHCYFDDQININNFL